jgi:glutamate/tyrosine decarboxylase-like PLP-dependent enzyme
MRYWRQLSQEAISKLVFEALARNVNYYDHQVLGIPASHLDSKVFYTDGSFLKDAPFLSTFVHNPNHIGCHTLGESEHFFKGTQDLEREVIALCAEDIFEAEPGSCDGYLASGGTEANIQAVWIYRNYFKRQYQARLSEICLLTSEDAHYSVDKAADILGVRLIRIGVDTQTREIDRGHLEQSIEWAVGEGVRYFIVVANMMTTLFGSVDNPLVYSEALGRAGVPFRIHVDAAFGGFFYPFSCPGHLLSFSNPHIHSITLDAHKMAQAPYGTGIFLVRKGYMGYTNTAAASYIEGQDCTLVGSRSGASAVAVWMILMKNGPYGWAEKVHLLLRRTSLFCRMLEDAGLGYMRQPHSNIVNIRSAQLEPSIIRAYGLVPDNHHRPSWYKIVVMDHVTMERLESLAGLLRFSSGLESLGAAHSAAPVPVPPGVPVS